MNEVSYKGYIIRPAPMQLANGRWNDQLYVRRNKGFEIAQKSLQSAETFDTREEVIARCIAAGKKIIDGELPHCTVVDL